MSRSRCTGSRRIRAALIGAGAVAETGHLPAVRAQAHRLDLVAVVDVDAERARTFAARHDVPSWYTDPDAMLAREQPDLVLLCTPPADHLTGALRCLEAGAWVWLEKPPVRSLAEYDRLQAAEKPGGPYASVVFQHRFGSAGLRAARLSRSGALGRALTAQCVTAWHRPDAYYAVPWRGTWESEGGGPTFGLGIHQMDLMLAVLGDWAEVRAMAARLERATETEDVSTALVRFESGALATVVNSALSLRQESYLRFDFSRASLELRHLYGYGDEDWTCTPPELFAPDGPEGGGVRSGHAAQLPLLLDAMEAGARPPLSGAEGRASLELVTAVYRSAFTGRPVLRQELDLQDPFHHALHGDVPGWAPARAAEREVRA